jgi:hypothetical protein
MRTGIPMAWALSPRYPYIGRSGQLGRATYELRSTHSVHVTH